MARTPCELATAMRTRAAGHVANGSYARALRGLDRADVLCPQTAGDGQRLLLDLLVNLGAFSRAEVVAAALDKRDHTPAETASINAARKVIAEEKARTPPDADTTRAMRALYAEGTTAYVNKDYSTAVAKLGKVWETMRPQGETLYALAMAELDINKGVMAVGIRLKLDRAMLEMEQKGAAVTLDTPNGFRGPVAKIAWSPDGRTLAVASDRDVSIVPTSTLREAFRLRGHTEAVATLAFSPDSKTFASGAGDRTVRIWDVATGSTLFAIDAQEGGVGSVAFSADGKTIATGGPSVRLWDAATGKVLRELGTPNFRCLAFSPDGKTIATGSHAQAGADPRGNARLSFWDTATGHATWRTIESSTAIAKLSFSPDGKTIASASGDGTIRLWSVAAGVQVRTFAGKLRTVSSLVFSPDGKTIASGGERGWVRLSSGSNIAPVHNDGLVLLWSVATGRLLHELDGGGEVSSVVFAPDGRTMASSSIDGAVLMRDVATGKVVRKLEAHSRAVSSVAASPDGKTVAAGGVDHSPRLWEVGTRSALRTLEGHTEAIRAVSFSPDGRMLASGSEDTSVRLWDVATSKLLRKLEEKRGGDPVHALAFSADGRTLASAMTAEDVSLRLWTVATGEPFSKSSVRQPDGSSSDESFNDGSFNEYTSVPAVAFSPDGKTLATSSDRAYVRLWDFATGDPLLRFAGTDPDSYVSALTFSPDGKLVATGASEMSFPKWHKVWLWDVATGHPVAALDGHQGSVTSVAFSRDGRALASGSTDRTVQIWDVATGKTMRALEGHDDSVDSIAFAHGGSVLASGSKDGSVRLWNAASGAPLLVLRAIESKRAGYAFTPDNSAVEFLGDDPAAVRQYPVCRVGPRTFPFELCAGRFEIPGLMPAVLHGDGLDEVL